MTWAQRLKRVSGIDVNTCVHCGGTVRIVASIEDSTAIRAILSHFESGVKCGSSTSSDWFGAVGEKARASPLSQRLA